MIKFLDLQKINLLHQEEIEQALLETFRSGWYLLGDKVDVVGTIEINTFGNKENIQMNLKDIRKAM